MSDVVLTATLNTTATDPPGVYKVVTSFPTEQLPSGSIYRIATGAPLPPGMDACIMVEDTEVVTRDEGGEEVEVRLLAQVDRGENVRKEGSDVRAGEKVLERGDVITRVGGELGTLAFVGKKTVRTWVLSLLVSEPRFTELRVPRFSPIVDRSSRFSRPGTSLLTSMVRPPLPIRPSPVSLIRTGQRCYRFSSTFTMKRWTSGSAPTRWPRRKLPSRRERKKPISSSRRGVRAWE